MSRKLIAKIKRRLNSVVMENKLSYVTAIYTENNSVHLPYN